MIDLADVAALLRANRTTLDLDYLNHWAYGMKADEVLARVWKEAFFPKN